MTKENNSQVKTISYVLLITMAGKLLGLLRDRLLAVNYGTGMYSNAFLIASRIPRVFFDVLFASAIAASFIPIFSETLKKKGRGEAIKFSGNFITVIGILTFVLSIVGIIFAEPIVQIFANGYDAETAALSVNLTRIMFPTIFFTGLAYSFVGILQSFDEFNIPAFISVLSNGIIIAYYIIFNDRFGIYGLAVAFLIGWSMQAIIQIPSLKKKGFHFMPSASIRNEEMKKVIMLMIPVLISTWVQPINLTINTRFASHLYNGAGVSQIEYSTNLYLIIVGVFILSITNVIFPKLSKLQVADEKDAFGSTVRTTMHASLYFVIPMMCGVMALSYQLIDLVYGGGQFNAEDTMITGKALLFVSLGMVGYAVQNILSRVYFAKQDGKTPLAAGIISIFVNIVLCLVLVDRFSVSGLAAASAVSGTVNALVLMIPLEIKGEGFLSKTFLIDMMKIIASACIMTVAVYFSAGQLTGIAPGIAGKLIVLLVPTCIGMFVFFAATALLRVEEALIVTGICKKIINKLSKRG